MHVTTILGWPLEHTLSPEIHNAAFRELALEWAYEAWPVRPRRLRRALARFRKGEQYVGANVTMPHKEKVLPLLDETSGDASAIGAVNTIQKLGPKLVGHNTDVDGFREFLSADAGYDARDKRALVLGAGGAARAVVRALGELGAAEIAVAGRRAGKRAEVANLVPTIRTSEVSWDDAASVAEGSDLVVNATPLGMNGENPLPNARWRAGQVVVDVVYRPPVTPVMAAARAQGAVAWGGLGMLIHQAAASFRIWTGQDPPLETMSAAALHALGPLRADG
jgi:shikimate dehydrogenase